MNNSESTLAQVKSILLEPYNLTEQDLALMLSTLLSNGSDMGDIYFQSMCYESWTLEDSQVKKSVFSNKQGVGFRSVVGEKSGLAYSETFDKESLLNAVKAAKSIANKQKNYSVKIEPRTTMQHLYPSTDPVGSLSDNNKIKILELIDSHARAKDHRVKEVVATLAGSYQTILIINQQGCLTTDIRPMVRLSVNVIVEENGRRESGSSGGGGRIDYSLFNNKAIYTYAEEAVEQALVNLEAKEAPAGEMTVVLGSGWPGVLIHEAIGHGLEGDFNRKKTSAFSDLMGEKVASSICTVIDDGTWSEQRGSLNIDDEGEPTQRTILIENGRLCNYMQDKLNARLMGAQTTGNGRRESYAAQTIPRMTNTFMAKGPHEHAEIIESVKSGLYAKNFGGGQVDITSGKFVFSASEAYMIKNGKLDAPVKGAMLIGDGPSTLHQVSMVGNDLALDPGIGSCGKEGQTVPVSVGQPSMKIDKLTVGGTN
jgi:TldD protein